jgi:hypothetical protein
MILEDHFSSTKRAKPPVAKRHEWGSYAALGKHTKFESKPRHNRSYIDLLRQVNRADDLLQRHLYSELSGWSQCKRNKRMPPDELFHLVPRLG